MGSKICILANGCGVSQQKFVPGDGPVPARVMFVGESPTLFAQTVGMPFPPSEETDDAGGILHSWFVYIGLDRSEVYVTNVVKCPRRQDNAVERMGLARKYPALNPLNSPSDEQFRACAPWLLDELRQVSPKLVVILGGVA